MAIQCRDDIQGTGMVGLSHSSIRAIRTRVPRFGDGATGGIRCLRRTQNRKRETDQRSGEVAPRHGMDGRNRIPVATI
jgi:hypothetical protein